MTGAGEAVALLLRLVSGRWADRTRRYWALTIGRTPPQAARELSDQTGERLRVAVREVLQQLGLDARERIRQRARVGGHLDLCAGLLVTLQGH